MRSRRRTASAFSGSKSTVRGDEGSPKQQRSQQVDEATTEEIGHGACPFNLERRSVRAPLAVISRVTRHVRLLAVAMAARRGSNLLKAGRKRCSRSSFGG